MLDATVGNLLQIDWPTDWQPSQNFDSSGISQKSSYWACEIEFYFKVQYSIIRL
jgi:hypothetical protein